MALILQEDWTAYAENTEVQNITGWATSGFFPVNLAGAQVNASSQIKSTTSDGTLAYFDSTANDCSIEGVIDAAPQGGAEAVGIAIRCIDHQNFIGMRLFGTSNIEVYQRTGSATFNRLAIPAYTHVAGDNYRFDLEGDTLKLFVNDVQLGSDIDVTGIHSGSNVGFFIQGFRDPLIGAVEINTLVNETISIDPAPDRKVFPVFGATRNHTISGTYSGITAPTSIEYRIEEFVSGATVTDWTTLDGSPSGGTYSGSVSIPKGKYYKILTRYSNLTNITAQTLRIGFGILAEFGGQSNTEALFNSGNATPLDDTCIFDGTSAWAIPTNQYVAHALNEISTDNNCVVAAYSTAVSSSSILDHVSGGSNYAARQAALTAAGSELNFFYWGQGEADAAAISTTYETDLGTLYNDLLTRTGQSSSTLPMFIAQLGRNEGQTGNDTGWQNVRSAQTSFANATSNVYISHQTMDLPMADSLHRDASGYEMESLRLADTINSIFTLSGNTGQGVLVTGATINGDELVVSHNLNGSSNIILPTNSKDGYEVSDDDFISVLVINSIAVNGNNITLTLNTSPTATVKLRSQQGQDPDHTKFPTGDLTYDGQNVMVEPIINSLTASVIESTINLSITGIPDGTYTTVLDDESGIRLFRGSVSYASGLASQALNAPVGTRVKGYVDDGGDPSSDAAYIEGVTV